MRGKEHKSQNGDRRAGTNTGGAAAMDGLQSEGGGWGVRRVVYKWCKLGSIGVYVLIPKPSSLLQSPVQL